MGGGQPWAGAKRAEWIAKRRSLGGRPWPCMALCQPVEHLCRPVYGNHNLVETRCLRRLQHLETIGQFMTDPMPNAKDAQAASHGLGARGRLLHACHRRVFRVFWWPRLGGPTPTWEQQSKSLVRCRLLCLVSAANGFCRRLVSWRSTATLEIADWPVATGKTFIHYSPTIPAFLNLFLSPAISCDCFLLPFS